MKTAIFVSSALLLVGMILGGVVESALKDRRPVGSMPPRKKSLEEIFGKAPDYTEGYRVVSHDNSTGDWTLIRTETFDGEYRTRRLIVRCEFAKFPHQSTAVYGPQACSLQVGRNIKRNVWDGVRGADRVDVTEIADDWLAIDEGEGDESTSQHFQVLKDELLSRQPR